MEMDFRIEEVFLDSPAEKAGWYSPLYLESLQAGGILVKMRKREAISVPSLRNNREQNVITWFTKRSVKIAAEKLTWPSHDNNQKLNQA